MKDPGKFFKNNLANSLQLIEAAILAGVKRFVLSSSAAVYASNDLPLTEESAIDPANAYGFTKLAIEQALEWYRKIKGLHFAALRYFNACGALPGRGEAHQPESHLIPLVLKVALGQQDAARYLRDRLPYSRRHLHPRLHPHCRLDLSAPAGIGSLGRYMTGWSITSATGAGTR